MTTTPFGIVSISGPNRTADLTTMPLRGRIFIIFALPINQIITVGEIPVILETLPAVNMAKTIADLIPVSIAVVVWMVSTNL